MDSAQPAASRQSSSLTPGEWGQDRRRLGQANVGFWVVASVAVLAFAPSTAGIGPLQAWGLFCLAVVVLQTPFDIWGGYVLTTRHGRRDQSLGEWSAAWMSGVVVHGLLFFIGGAILLGTSAAFGAPGALAAAAAISLSLIALQHPLSLAVGHLHQTPVPGRVSRLADRAGLDATRLRVLESDDTGYVGGWTGLPGAEHLSVPLHWVQNLSNDALHAALVRRQIARDSGRRARGVVAALGFNLTGLALVLAILAPNGAATADVLIRVVCGMTLWSFLGVLTLPQFSRRAIFEIDRATIALTSRERLESLIRTLDRDQADEPQRGPVVEYIYHPVPTPENRVAELAKSQDDAPSRHSPWRVTRNALYLSIACGGLLSRAVHCNIGRPNVWVIFPGD